MAGAAGAGRGRARGPRPARGPARGPGAPRPLPPSPLPRSGPPPAGPTRRRPEGGAAMARWTGGVTRENASMWSIPGRPVRLVARPRRSTGSSRTGPANASPVVARHGEAERAVTVAVGGSGLGLGAHEAGTFFATRGAPRRRGPAGARRRRRGRRGPSATGPGRPAPQPRVHARSTRPARSGRAAEERGPRREQSLGAQHPIGSGPRARRGLRPGWPKSRRNAARRARPPGRARTGRRPGSRAPRAASPTAGARAGPNAATTSGATCPGRRSRPTAEVGLSRAPTAPGGELVSAPCRHRARSPRVARRLDSSAGTTSLGPVPHAAAPRPVESRESGERTGPGAGQAVRRGMGRPIIGSARRRGRPPSLRAASAQVTPGPEPGRAAHEPLGVVHGVPSRNHRRRTARGSPPRHLGRRPRRGCEQRQGPRPGRRRATPLAAGGLAPPHRQEDRGEEREHPANTPGGRGMRRPLGQDLAGRAARRPDPGPIAKNPVPEPSGPGSGCLASTRVAEDESAPEAPSPARRWGGPRPGVVVDPARLQTSPLTCRFPGTADRPREPRRNCRAWPPGGSPRRCDAWAGICA